MFLDCCWSGSFHARLFCHSLARRSRFGCSSTRLVLSFLLVATALATATPSATAQHSQAAPPDIAALKAEYRRPPARPIENQHLVDLGRLLFWDPRLSASGKTACVSCHLPYVGWAVTDRRSRGDSGRLTSRKSQPLVGIGHVEGIPFGWDGRSASLEAQIKASIATGSMSMSGTDKAVKVEAITERVRAVPLYAEKFNAALPNAPIDIEAIAKAIAAYERTMEPGIAPFDQWIAGDEGAISESAKRGFVLFNTKANCAACHSGWRFTNDSFHDIGTSTTDLGRGRQLKTVQIMQYAFKTPTLRSCALRPPYMHNGVMPNLYEVVRHYEKGGIERPSRSVEMFPLQLSEQDRLDLVAFMQTLTGVVEGETAPTLPVQ
jgi:cytochrome c peroxidase